jgi:competence protein ComEA
MRMALFTKQDRMVIVVIAVLIVIGWGVRLTASWQTDPGDIQVHRQAAENIPAFDTADSPNTALMELVSPVNINTADVEKLMTLPLIGPVKAAAIVEYRETSGAFDDIHDITNVSGIGPATFERIKTRITIQTETEANGQ